MKISSLDENKEGLKASPEFNAHASAGPEQIPQAKTAQQPIIHCEPPKDAQAEAPPRNRKFANKVFNVLTYLGLGFAANSALSLWITYNALPTETAQQGIHGLKKTLRPVAVGWDKFKGLFGKSKLNHMSEIQREMHLNESARSTAEVLCMAIAGTIMLFPMKWMENTKEWWVDKVDRWRNPDYYKYCADNNLDPKAAIKPEGEKDEPKQTWGRLLTARVIGLASVLGIDAAIQVFNNKRFDKGKGNFDTVEWNIGSWLYDKLPDGMRERMVNFFSRKGVSIEGVNPQVQKHLLETLDAPSDFRNQASRLSQMREDIRMHPSVVNAPNWTVRREALNKLEGAASTERAALQKGLEEFKTTTERAVFAEQTRLFSKEVSLTLIMAGLVFAFSKTGIMSSVLQKLGIKKKTERNIEEIIEDTPLLPVTGGDPDPGVAHKSKKSSALDPEQYRKAPLAKPSELHTQKLETQPSDSLQLGA